MRYHVRHETRYSFDASVFLEPHTIRARPRDGAGQRLTRYEITIDPVPTVVTETADLYGNIATQAWFEGTTPSLEIVVDFEVETTRPNPFDYLLLPEAERALPWAPRAGGWAAYLSREAGTGSVDALAADVLAGSPGVVGFLTSLMDRLHRDFAIDIREEGAPHPAEFTLAARIGSCRDLAVLMAEACRGVGIPARFVSGYQEGDPHQDRRDLHAWTEVYIPGAGWRGYDPTLGLAVADQHIAVAAGPSPADAAPVAGTFRGRARASLANRIDLDVLA